MGKDLQEFLLKHCHIKMILDNEKRRSFAQVEINTIIALFSSPDEKSERGLDKKAHFVMFRVPFEEVLSPVIFQEIEEAERVSADPKYRQLQVAILGTSEEFTITELSRPEYRVRVLEQTDLYKDGLAYADGETKLISAKPKYSGGKWGGKYLRAPEVFWRILGKGNLCRLDSIAQIITGLKEAGYGSYIVKLPTLGRVEQYHMPLLKDPSAHRTIRIICADAAIPIGNHPREAEKAASKIAPILWLAMRGDRHVCYENISLLPFTGNFFGICPIASHDEQLLLAFCNSSLACLIAEVYGRKGFGGGASILVKIDLEQIPVPNPLQLGDKAQQQIVEALRSMKEREIKSIFEELSLPKANKDYSNIDAGDISLDKVLPDRRELDRIIFEAIGLTEGEQLEVYRAVVELVKNRLVKARSV